MRKKLIVKWDARKQEYVCTHPDTNVTGYSDTSPGDAVRNWQYWWQYPY